MNEFDELLNQMLGPKDPAMTRSDDDAETWLLTAADEVHHKKAERGGASLTAAEHAIYCMWVIDYAVRNSGTLEPMRELYPGAGAELEAFARRSSLGRLGAWAKSIADEARFCETYEGSFPSACAELRAHLK